MNRASTILTILAVAIFVASGLLFAMEPLPRYSGMAANGMGYGLLGLDRIAPEPAPDLAMAMVRPRMNALWLLSMAVWAGLALHAARLASQQWRHEAAHAACHTTPAGGAWPLSFAGPPTAGQMIAAHGRDHAPVELAPLTAALIAGALWPWVWVRHPVAGFLLAVAMLIAALGAVIRGQREGTRIRSSTAVGLFAGWATAATYAGFASLMASHLGLPTDVAGLSAMLLCAGTGVFVQWQVTDSPSYSIGLIWALVGLTAVTMAVEPAIAIGAVIAISGMAVAVVRAAT